MSLVKKYIIKTGVKYGITGSIIIILFYTGLLLLDKNIFIPALSILAILMVVLIILFAILEYNQIDIVPKFWKNMSVGMISNFIIAVVFSLLMIVVLKIVKPELHESYIKDRMEMMLEYKETYIEKFGQEHFDLLLSDVETTSPIALAFDGPIKMSFSGMFFTILLSAIFYLIKSKSSKSD